MNEEAIARVGPQRHKKSMPINHVFYYMCVYSVFRVPYEVSMEKYSFRIFKGGRNLCSKMYVCDVNDKNCT